ncbi:hypothetical protein MA16_Dca010520 [Dendrobium catenatum]|uniref:Uncharacterized protein n=1 Tax=Dendrobium catenatum TaxID=906689 RepID=A0A2I0XF09_9ASPA|nr:hypothetical protein MA16_Dca010520 [Dendrobium catenatum]
MSKLFEEAYELIEEITTKNFQWSVDRVNPKRIHGVYESYAFSILTTQAASISKKLHTVGVNSRLGLGSSM